MSAHTVHRALAAQPQGAPWPFRTFAVRSDEPQHAWAARAPYAWVHVLHTQFLDAGALARLASDGHARVRVDDFSDIDHATPSAATLAALTPGVASLPAQVLAAMRATGVLGCGTAGGTAGGAADGTANDADDDDDSPDAAHATTRIDYLGTCGAGFHNDVNGHWSRCLFWLLALNVADVDFVMPHAGVCVGLAAGDLLVFDQTMAHGLCRPSDHGQAVASSFAQGAHRRQMFLTGEVPLSDARWAALGAPWLPVEAHAAQGALDLMVAEFDPRTGAVKRPSALRDCMLRSTCHVDGHTNSGTHRRVDRQAASPAIAATRSHDQ